MGFDFGTQKIGVAVGQRLTGTATPVAIVRAVNGAPDWHELERLVVEWQPAKLIVGLPINMDDSESDMSRLARRFAQRLAGRFGVPVETMDERLSSFEVRSEHKGEQRDIDDLAAVVILESWLRQ